ncbi:SpoIIE family protein phosphatase [Blastococcus sp. SYSU DS0619]
MSGPDGQGRWVLLDPSTAELALLRALPGADHISPGELETRLQDPAEPVDLVVVGSQAPSPVALAQRVHRLAPEAGVAVLTTDPVAVRRQASYAPGVPLELLVAEPDAPDLIARLREVRRTTADRRRHRAVLAAVVRRATGGDHVVPRGTTDVGALLENAPIAALVVDPGGALLGWNRRAEVLFDLARTPTGHPVDAVLPGATAVMAPVVAPDGPDRVPEAAPAAAHVLVGGRVDVELTAVRSRTDDGRPVVLLLAVDVTARREAERERDRLAGQVGLLARVSESLVGSLDVDESIARLAGALVPAVADWVSIQVRGERDQLAAHVARHRDPALAPLVRRLEQAVAQRGAGSRASRRASAGEAVLLPVLDEEALAEQVPDPELRDLAARLGTASVLAVPVPGREGVLGSVLLVRGADAEEFGERDLPVAREVGRRAGIALDNARLYTGQRHLATELQNSLLTDPPALPFAEVAVRYVAAAREAQVGGDWYDAFRQRDGDLTVVIGDVVGHDIRAAAAMGQLRSLVRGIGYTTAGTPGQVLSVVDEAVEGLELSTLATAVLAVIRPVPGGARVRWSNAGHPPPVLVPVDGPPRLLEYPARRPDLLLGVDPRAARHTAEVQLPRGATLLLYTDGLVESRSHTLDDGLRSLLAAVDRHAGDELDDLCDAVLARMVPRGGQDDVAMVAVRPRSEGGGAPPAGG